jgi:hypothetical protein
MSSSQHHGCFSSQSFWKRGSERKGSQCGSSLRRGQFAFCYLLGPICSGPESSCWKSGRLRIGSQTGSIFKATMDAAQQFVIAQFSYNCGELLAPSRMLPNALSRRQPGQPPSGASDGISAPQFVQSLGALIIEGRVAHALPLFFTA